VGPQGVPLMVLLTVVAAGLLASTLWLWAVLARRGAAFVALRVALLAGLQVSVLGAIFIAVNRSNDFYASWADLLGTDHRVATVVAVPPAAAHDAAIRRVSLARPLVSSPVTVPGPQRGPAGRLEKVRFNGPLSGIDITGHVYLPPGYSAASRPLPVILVITRPAGGSGGYSAPQVAAAATAQIRTGRMAPAIIAVLPPAVAGSDDRGCLDSPGGPQAATFFSQDLPQALTYAFRAEPGPSGWAVLGGAGGGYCALQLATAASGQFGVAAAAPGSYTVPPGRGETAGSPGLRSQDNLLWRLRHWPPPPVRVLFAGPGQAGPFASLVRPPMSVTVASPPPGGQASAPPPLAPALDWISHALAARS
jgi:Putative esterase